MSDMGSDFLRKIGPIGAAIILIFSVVGTIMLFTVDFGYPPHYISLHDTEYYAQNEHTMTELLEELRDNIFPSLEGIQDSFVMPGGSFIVISTEKEHYDRVRAIILRDFDESLFIFSR